MYKRNDNETVFIEYIICPGKVGVVAVHALGPTGVAQLAHIIALVEDYEYEAMTLTLERRIPVPGSSFGVSGIAACSRNKCLYLSD